jgi:hypothetical protein
MRPVKITGHLVRLRELETKHTSAPAITAATANASTRIVTDAAWDETEAKHVKDAHAQAVKVIDREYGRRVPEHPGDPLCYTLFGIAAEIYEGKSH